MLLIENFTLPDIIDVGYISYLFLEPNKPSSSYLNYFIITVIKQFMLNYSILKMTYCLFLYTTMFLFFQLPLQELNSFLKLLEKLTQLTHCPINDPPFFL